MTFFWKFKKSWRKGGGIFFIFCHMYYLPFADLIFINGLWKNLKKSLIPHSLNLFLHKTETRVLGTQCTTNSCGHWSYVLDGKKVNDMMRVWVWIWFFWRWRRDKNIIIIGGRDINIEKSGVIIIYYQSANFFFMSNASILVGERVTETWVPGTHSTA